MMFHYLVCKRDDVVMDDCLNGFATQQGGCICMGCYYRETGKRLTPSGWLGREMIAAVNAA